MAILYDSAGNPIYPNAPTGSYMANISIRHTAADAAGSVVFAMTNPTGSGRVVYIRNIRGRVFFDGTAVAGGNSGYELIRYSGNAAPTTGTTVPRIKKRTGYSSSVISDTYIQQKSGIITLTGAVFEAGPFNVIRIPASGTGIVAQFDIDLVVAGMGYEGFELQTGEGLAIRLNVAAIIGLGIAGQIEWDER